MSNLVTLGRVGRNRASAVISPQTSREDLHTRLAGQLGSLNVTLKSTDQQSAAPDEPVIGRHSDSRPAFVAWWERWREATSRISPASIRRHF